MSPEIKKATFAKFDELASREIDWNTAEKQASFKDTFDMYAERAVKEGAVPNKETFYKMYEARQYDYPDVYKEAIKQPYLEGGASSVVNGKSVKNFACSPNRFSMPSKTVPCPMISRNAPSTVKLSAIPNPIENPSQTEWSKLFFEANASARPITIQLVTISGIKIPSD